MLPARSAPKARSPVPMASPRREGAAAPLALMSPLVLPLHRLGAEPPALIAAGWALVDPQLLYLLQPVVGGRSFLIVGQAEGLVSLFFTGGCPALTWVPFVIARHGCRPPRSGGHGWPDTPAVVGYGGSWHALRLVSGAAAAVQEARRDRRCRPCRPAASASSAPPPGADRQRGGGYGHGPGGVGAARAGSAQRGPVLPVSVAENIARGTGYPRRAGLVSWRRHLVSQGPPTDHSLSAWGTSSARNCLTTPPRPRPAARPSAVSSEQHQAATVPEPPSPAGPVDRRRVKPSLLRPSASGYVAPFHITTAVDRDSARTWDPAGHQGVYRKIWGRAQRRRRACCLTAADRSRRVRTPTVPPSAVAGRTR